MELETAKSEFHRLGAVRDAAAADQALQAAAERELGPRTTRKTFLFTDMVGSTALAETLGDQAWEHLLRWHDDALQELFVRHGGEVVNRTGDGFFVAFEEPRPAVDCSVAIQRALAEHRRTHGFAPPVRIGLHASDANRRGGDYSGSGVHVAARIAALAEGGQILVSAQTAAAAGASYAHSEPRTVTLKGISEQVAVISIDWARANR